jgi:hypothetical protein
MLRWGFWHFGVGFVSFALHVTGCGGGVGLELDLL